MRIIDFVRRLILPSVLTVCVLACSSAPPKQTHAADALGDDTSGDDTSSDGPSGDDAGDPLARYTDDQGPVTVDPLDTLVAGPGASSFADLCKKTMQLASGAVVTCMVACNVATGNVPTPVGDIGDALKDCREKQEQVEQDTQAGTRGNGSQLGDIVPYAQAVGGAAIGGLFLCFASGLCELVLAPVGI